MTGPLEQQLDRMITGYWTSQAIYAAAKFGIADLLKDGPRSVEDLAEASSTNADALHRLLRALASIGIFSESSPGVFSLTPLAGPLRSDVNGSKRALALMSGDEQFRAWGEIDYSIRTGETAFEKVFGKPIFDYLSEQPDKARIFDAAMTGIHGRETGDVLDVYDFSGVEVLADIGGGNGTNITAILKQHPAMKGILFDLRHVVERAGERIEAAGVSDRCRLISGNFFESIPAGANAYFMRHIIHDWDDEKSLTILRNCHAAMPADGRLLVVESVIPPGNERFGAKFLDLVMLLIPGRKGRTEDEYRALFEAAGFELLRIVTTATELSVIDGHYYVFYLDRARIKEGPNRGELGYDTHLVRSRDLKRWEPSPLNPVLTCSGEDRKICDPEINLPQQQRIARSPILNVSDMDLCEFEDQVIFYYSWGSQRGDRVSGRGPIRRHARIVPASTLSRSVDAARLSVNRNTGTFRPTPAPRRDYRQHSLADHRGDVDEALSAVGKL